MHYMKGNPWSSEEVVATVNIYLQMLKMELANQNFVKREYNRRLAESLDARSLGAIEMKHMNISAALIQLGCPFVRGYKPYSNFQGLLFHEVAKQIGLDEQFHRLAIEASEKTTNKPLIDDFDKVLSNIPVIDGKVDVTNEPANVKRPKIDYLALEQRNRSLGLAGEEFVVDYERWQLKRHGLVKLAGQVVHTSVAEGDGAGYDIQSFDLDGNKQFIEVKTTSYTEATPFWITKNEVRFSRVHHEQYQITRVFDFRTEPRLFVLPGQIDDHGKLDAELYRVHLA